MIGSTSSVPTYSYSSSTLYPQNEDNDVLVEDNSSTAPEEQTENQASYEETNKLPSRKCEVLEEPETFVSRTKRFLAKIPTALCIPLRICTTLLSAGVFAGYYVTVMSITGVAALTGVLIGMTSKINSNPSQKSLKDYAVTYAQKTFEVLTFPYEKLPAQLKGSIFPVISGAVFFLFETMTIPGKKIPIKVYEKLCSNAYAATKPYKPITDMTARLFEVTKSFIQE